MAGGGGGGEDRLHDACAASRVLVYFFGAPGPITHKVFLHMPYTYTQARKSTTYCHEHCTDRAKQKCHAPKCMKPTRPAAVACDAHADARPPPCAPSGLADTSARPGPGLATCIECCLLQSFDVILYAQKDFARVKIDSARLGWSGLMLIEKSGQHPCQLWACLYSVAEPIDISILKTI